MFPDGDLQKVIFRLHQTFAPELASKVSIIQKARKGIFIDEA